MKCCPHATPRQLTAKLNPRTQEPVYSRIKLHTSRPMKSPEPMELLSHAWCSSAIQVFEPTASDGPMTFKEFAETDTPLTVISRRAEMHAAISVAGVAAALAAIAAENAELNQKGSLKETAMASAAALVAAQCAQVAEAVGANRDQLASAINAAMTTTDANNIITLTAAAATSLKGAATLRGRPGHKERRKGDNATLLQNEFDFDFDFIRCRASLVKGDELLVRTPDGK